MKRLEILIVDHGLEGVDPDKAQGMVCDSIVQIVQQGEKTLLASTNGDGDLSPDDIYRSWIAYTGYVARSAPDEKTARFMGMILAQLGLKPDLSPLVSLLKSPGVVESMSSTQASPEPPSGAPLMSSD